MSLSPYNGPEIEVPDGIEPIIGWREWAFKETGLLFSLTNSQFWTPRRSLEAACTSRSHARSVAELPPDERNLFERLRREVYGGADLTEELAAAKPKPDLRNTSPVEGCSCGIYAKRHPIDVTQKVVGTVKLWGKVIVGTEGYRAQFGYPHQVYVLLPDVAPPEIMEVGRRLAQRIGRLYQCDVSAVGQSDYYDRVNLALCDLYTTAVKKAPGTGLIVETEPDDDDDDAF